MVATNSKRDRVLPVDASVRAAPRCAGPESASYMRRDLLEAPFSSATSLSPLRPRAAPAGALSAVRPCPSQLPPRRRTTGLGATAGTTFTCLPQTLPRDDKRATSTCQRRGAMRPAQPDFYVSGRTFVPALRRH
jgi:hypothetical protein